MTEKKTTTMKYGIFEVQREKQFKKEEIPTYAYRYVKCALWKSLTVS